MRTRNALERLAAAGRPLLAEAESLVDADDEERILDRILASDPDRSLARRGSRPWARGAVLAALAVAVAAGVSFALIGGWPATPVEKQHAEAGLSRRTIALAGYRFRLPAGYRQSARACVPVKSTPGRPMTVVYAVRAAAAAEGGCLNVTLTAGSPPIPPGAEAVTVGPFSGFLASAGSGQETLYLQIPVASGGNYLVLSAQGLTSEQLLAVARSGLPG